MPHILVVGLSHHTAPLDVRERLVLAPDAAPEALARVRARPGVREAALVSTCNRSELYAVTETYHAGREELEKGLTEIALPHGGVADEYLYRLEGAAVVRHLFRVAGSLDALVVGEPQVLGQVKDAFRIAQESNSAGPIVDRLFRHAIEVGKRVRAETEIGAYAVSVSYAAVELAKKIFGPLAGRAALIIGAGETGELTMRHLKSAGVSDLRVANRTIGTAEALAGELGARPLRLGDLEEALRQVDIVISSTGATVSILDRRTVERAMKERRGRPLFLIDIAVPRDIDPACGSVYNVFLYNIDDLGRVVTGNRERRLAEAERALEIVNQEVARFMRWFEGLETVPTIVALRERLEAVRGEETQKVLKRLEHLSERDRKLVEQFGETLLHRLLHGPTAQLRHVGSGERGIELASALRYLFRLEEGAGPRAGERGSPGTGNADANEERDG